MVSESDLIHMIAGKLRQYRAKNIVVDPVMVATSGARLISEEAVDVLKEELFPLADLLTPISRKPRCLPDGRSKAPMI